METVPDDVSPAEPLRLMAVHAHPDDESSKGAATMARYVDEGVSVLVVTCTGGERGSGLNPGRRGAQSGAAGRSAYRGEHRLDPPAGDGRRPRDPGHQAGVAGLRRLRSAR